jgi:hypothetical protein
MATTAKELIELLQKYTEPNEIVIWQYYTRGDFDYDDNQPPITNEQFEMIADKVERYEIWQDARDAISEGIWEYQNNLSEQENN